MAESHELSELRNYSPEVHKVILTGAKNALPQRFKADIISTHEKLQSYLPESYVGPEVEKVHVIADTLATLGQRVGREVAKKLKLHKKISDIKAQEENVVTFVGSELEKSQVISDILSSLGGKVEQQIKEKPILKRKSTKQIIGLIIESEIEKVPTIAETLDSWGQKVEEEVSEKLGIQKAAERSRKSFVELAEDKAQAVADTLASLKKQVEQNVAESLVGYEIERARAIGDILSSLGERVERILIDRLGCPELTVKEIAETLSQLKEYFDKDVGRRAFAVESNVHKTILKVLTIFFKEVDITYPALEALISLSHDLPEVLDNEAISIVMHFLDHCPTAATKQQILKWINICMSQSENIRSTLYERGIIPRLKTLLEDDTTTSPVIRDVCHAIGALAEYDKHCHTHKSSMKALQRVDEAAMNFLVRITYLLRKFLDNPSLLKDIIITIRKLLVVNYLCELILYIKKGKALLYLYDVFINHRDSEELIYELMRLFHVMVTNDIAKSTMMEAGVAYIIKHAMDSHIGSEDVLTEIFLTIATISLRCPFNTALLVDFGFPARIINGMQKHRSAATIQKIGSWILRIFVTYVNDLVPFLIHLGASDALRDSIINHSYKCEFDAKAALRDLLEEVDLYEPIRNPISDIRDIQFPL